MPEGKQICHVSVVLLLSDQHAFPSHRKFLKNTRTNSSAILRLFVVYDEVKAQLQLSIILAIKTVEDISELNR